MTILTQIKILFGIGLSKCRAVRSCGELQNWAAPLGGVTRPLLFFSKLGTYNNDSTESQNTHNTTTSMNKKFLNPNCVKKNSVIKRTTLNCKPITYGPKNKRGNHKRD